MKKLLTLLVIAVTLCLSIPATADVVALGDTGVNYQVIPPDRPDQPNYRIGFELPRILLATDRGVVLNQANFNGFAKKVPEATHKFAKVLYTDPSIKSFGISFREVLVTLYFDTDPEVFVKNIEKAFKEWIDEVD